MIFIGVLSVALTLAPVGKNAPAGTAVLSQQSGGLLVTLRLPERYKAGRAAIFSGTCNSSSSAAMTGDEPVQLNVNATGNAANTTLPDISLASLTSTPHVIEVLGTPALCGDLRS